MSANGNALCQRNIKIRLSRAKSNSKGSGGLARLQTGIISDHHSGE